MRISDNEDNTPTTAYTANLPIEVKCPKCGATIEYKIVFMHNQPDGEYLTVITI
jgi:rubredoxin